MENKNQYNQPGSSGTVPVTQPQQVITRTSTDIKIQQLEDQIANQHQLIVKLRRDIGRLKGDISDIVTMIKNRG